MIFLILFTKFHREVCNLQMTGAERKRIDTVSFLKQIDGL